MFNGSTPIKCPGMTDGDDLERSCIGGFIDFCPLHMAIHGIDGTILKVNALWRSTYGIRDDERIEGLSLYDLFGYLLRDTIRDVLNETLKSGGVALLHPVPSRTGAGKMGCYKTRVIANELEQPLAILVSLTPDLSGAPGVMESLRNSPQATSMLMGSHSSRDDAGRPQEREERGPANALPTEKLSVTEAAVLRLILEKRKYSEIASILRIQTATVKTHAMSIRKKLGIRGQSDVPLWRHFEGET